MTGVLLALGASAFILAGVGLFFAFRAMNRTIYARDAARAATRNGPGTLLGVVQPKDKNDD